MNNHKKRKREEETIDQQNEKEKVGGLYPPRRLCPTIDHIRKFRIIYKRWNRISSTQLFKSEYSKSAEPSLLIVDSDVYSLNTSHTLLEDFFKTPNPLPKTFSTSPIQLLDSRAFGEMPYIRPAIANSCKGFLGLYNKRHQEPVIFFNPLTGEYIRAPMGPWSDKRYTTLGLGFTEKKRQFKFIRFSFGELVGQPLVEVHTLGTRIWRTLKGAENFRSVQHYPIYLKSNLYFLVNFEANSRKIQVVSFNLDSELFESIPSPTDENKRELNFKSNDLTLANIGGSLCAVNCKRENDLEPLLTCWKLQNGAWLHLFAVALPTNFICCTCPRLFLAPRCSDQYIIHEDNNTKMLIYSETRIGFRRFLLHEPRGFGYLFFDHIPNLMHINQFVNNEDGANVIKR